MTLSIEKYQQRTQAAYVATRILDTPFWGLYNLLPIILFKNLGATPYQISLMIVLKPLVSLLSSYWATRFQFSSHIVSSITWGRFLAYLPFLFFPFFHSIWFFIFSFGFYMFLQVGMAPTWMELLKQNLPNEKRDQIFSYTQVFGYLGGGLLPFLLGWILDEWSDSWRWMFFITALIALGSFFWQTSICIKNQSPPKEELTSNSLLKPWKKSWELLKKRPDFSNFQIGFMLLGSGLMIIQPSLPIFFVEKLHLTFTEMGVAITLCKGIGFACSSTFWVKLIKKMDLFTLGSILAAIAIAFPLCLMAAQVHLVWLYVAYLIYGLMQSGNELSWNLSGPIFAKEENSSPYSMVNVIAVGIRGVFIPFLGAYFMQSFGYQPVIIFSGALCLLASLCMASFSKAQALKGISKAS